LRHRQATIGLALLALWVVGLACQAPAAAPPAAREPSRASQPPPAAAPAAAPAVATAPAAPAAPAPTPEPKRVTIALSSRSATNLPEYVALDHGIYARHGFDVELRQMQSSIVPAALMSNQLDFSNGIDSAMRASITGMPIKVVVKTYSAPAFGLTVKPEIQSIADLRGRVDGVAARAGAGYYSMKRLLAKHGMSIDEVQVLVVGDSPVQLQQLIQGNIDFANLAVPFVFVAQEHGFRMLSYVPDHISLAISGLVTSDEAIQTRRDEVRRMTAALVEATRFAHAQRDESVASLVKHLEVAPEHAAKAYDFAVPALALDPRLTLDELRATIQEEVENGHVAEAPAPERLVPFDLVEEALALVK
jgi:NitT/TauT family transport system substrate-binding protein